MELLERPPVAVARMHRYHERVLWLVHEELLGELLEL